MTKTTLAAAALLLACGATMAADVPPLTYQDVQAAQKKSTRQGDVVFDPFEGRPIRLTLTPVGKAAAGYYYVEKKGSIVFQCVKPQPGYHGGDTLATVVGTNAHEGISMQLTGCRPARS